MPSVLPVGSPEMIHALRSQQLHTVFQPQYRLEGLRLCGFEALARLDVGQQDWVPPDRFLPLAHAEGLLGALTLHMVEAACRAIRSWRNPGLVPVFVAVNIEPDDLADILFAPRVCRLLAEYQVLPGELEFELVERRYPRFDNISAINISQLRAAGIRIAMDDFGTGESALSQLCELPFDIVKIDKSFLARIPTDQVACILMRSVIDMCLALEKDVVVEGVESAAQLRWLERAGWACLRLQGNMLSFPLAESQAFAHIGQPVCKKPH